MNYYETLFIVHPALDSSRLKDIIISVQDMISGMNSKICMTDIWGKKKLAYLIDKQNYGTYVLVQFQSDGVSNNKISTELEHNPNILAYLTSRIEEDQLDQNGKSLDEQLSTRSSSSSENDGKPKADVVSESTDSEESESKADEVSESTDSEESESTTESNNKNNEDKNGTNE